MRLNTEKIRRLKEAQGLTWQQIADKMGANSRQYVYEYVRHERVTGAEKFAKVFGVEPIDLITTDRAA